MRVRSSSRERTILATLFLAAAVASGTRIAWASAPGGGSPTVTFALEGAGAPGKPASALPDAPDAVLPNAPDAVLPNAPDAVLSLTRDAALPGGLDATFSASAAMADKGMAFASAGKSTSSTESPAAPILTTPQLDAGCQSGQLHGKPCRAHWWPILWEAFEFTAVDNVGNIALDSDTQHDLRYNPYWATYIKCVHQYRYRQWTDDTPFIVHDIGHPMQGAIVDAQWEQNAPTARGEVFHNNGNYWRSRLKAMAWTAVFEVDWKIGPASEASIGNSGLNTYTTPALHGKTTNETGFQDFVITPVYGTGWAIGEDAIDRYLMPKIWRRTRNKWILTVAAFMTPCKAAANLFRYKPPYYRDFAITPLR